MKRNGAWTICTRRFRLQPLCAPPIVPWKLFMKVRVQSVRCHFIWYLLECATVLSNFRMLNSTPEQKILQKPWSHSTSRNWILRPAEYWTFYKTVHGTGGGDVTLVMYSSFQITCSIVNCIATSLKTNDVQTILLIMLRFLRTQDTRRPDPTPPVGFRSSHGLFTPFIASLPRRTADAYDRITCTNSIFSM